MSTWLHDLRFTLRTLGRQPAFALTATITLALGIGANSAIFSVVNAVLLQPLPYHQPERIVTALHNGTSPVAAGNYLDWRAQSRSFAHVAAAQAWGARQGPTVSGEGRAEIITPALRVTADLFEVLGVRPLLGRTFVTGDDQPGAAPSVVLSHRLWQRRFAGRADVVGRAVVLDGRAHTIVGVMPKGFMFAPFWIRDAELFAPLDLGGKVNDRRGESLRLFARLRPGVSIAEAQAETQAIWQRLERAHPGSTRADVIIGSLHEKAVGNVRRPLLVLLAGVSFVLLIACANVANLLLARAAARRREIGIRSALGAGRARLVRQLLTESLVLAFLGGGLGLALAHVGVDVLVAMAPSELPRMDHVSVDGRVLVFTLVLTLLTGVLFGLGPALRLSNLPAKLGARGVTEVRGRFRSALVVTQVALALVLLIGGGLMVRSFARLRGVDAGLDPRGVVGVALPSPQLQATDEQRRSFYQAVMRRVRALPGVSAAGAINHLPVGGDIWQLSFTVEGAPAPRPGDEPRAVYRVMTPGYIDALGLGLLRGRDFTDADTVGAPGVAIVNETMARAVWPGQDPIGKRITVEDGGPNPRAIVGVVKDVKQRDWAKAAEPEMYLAYLQKPSSSLTLVVRGARGSAVQNEIWAVDPSVPASRVTSMEGVVEEALGQPRFNLMLLSAFAGVALLLAAVGVYGVMAHTVNRRTRELGIRLAMGAQPWQVRRLVMRQGLTLTAAGVVAGLAVAVAMTRLMAALLFQVSALDPLTFVIVPAALVAVALLACWLPARRATRVDPMIALRAE